jgi:hypothetical protein
MKVFPVIDKFTSGAVNLISLLSDNFGAVGSCFEHDGFLNTYNYIYLQKISDNVCNEIVGQMTDENDQKTFDIAKRKLNLIDFSNLDVKYYLNFPIYEREHKNYISILVGFINRCRDLRNNIYNLMIVYNLKNNYPKNGFLCPFELEDVHEEDEARKQDKPEQKEESANNCILDRSNAMDRVNECIDDKTTPLNVGKDTYLKIYDCLLKYHVLDEKEDCKTFAYNLKHGDLSAEYKDDVKIYLRKLCAMILPNIKETDERKKWKHKIAVSFKLKNDDYITKYNTGVNANFVRDLEKIL